MEIRARRLALDDLEQLVELDSQCFATPWLSKKLAEELENTDAIVFGAFEQGALVGAICARLVYDEIWIFRIMTRPQMRRQKIAHKLLAQIDAAAHAFEQPCDLWLEVSAHNPSAIAFYEREGFRVKQVRKGYYPKERDQKMEADALVMKRKSEPWTLDYELKDFGEGYKLERYGNNTIMRPDAAAVGKPRQNRSSWVYQASCERSGPKGFLWEHSLDFQEPWTISRGPLNFELRTSQSKNIGLFPEQENNWNWLSKTISRSQKPLKVLNLFAYTGGATLICAQNGTEVCHVDSARSAVRWASENATRSGLATHPIRWIVDDAQEFIAKELRRGHRYDGIILDPPPMGHGQGGRFEFRKDAFELVASCKKLLAKEPAFFLLNAYAMNLTASQIGQLIGPILGLPLEVGELQIKESTGDRALSCSVFARYRPGN